jgi:transcriptional regulator with XRE-family HTH domain
MDTDPHPSLNEARRSIAAAVRSLRTERRWTQRELGARLGLSQARLSEVERGEGSFTAEQLMLMCALFNVPISHFAPRQPAGVEDQLQNALARLGANDLGEVPALLPSEQLAEVTKVVRETLLIGSPRLLVALAPVLVRHIDRISFAWLETELRAVGLERRVPWLAENVLGALQRTRTQPMDPDDARRHRRAVVVLESYLHTVKERTRRAGRPRDLDMLDRTIRSQQSIASVRARSAEPAKRWGVLTALAPDDFAHALEAALGAPT